MPAAAELYSQRCGVEVFFRSVKQNCERGKLHCGTPKNIITELNWTLLGISAALFTAKQALHEAGVPVKRLSPVKVLREFVAMTNWVAQQPHLAPLKDRLLATLAADESDRTTSKRSRDYPRKKKHRRCGAPSSNPPLNSRNKPPRTSPRKYRYPC